MSKHFLQISNGSPVTDYDRHKNNFYATHPLAVHMLLEKESFSRKLGILEPFAGKGHIGLTLRRLNYSVTMQDKFDYGLHGVQLKDFYDNKPNSIEQDIITNPPYKRGNKKGSTISFVRHILKSAKPDRKIALFLKLSFFETDDRKELFREFPFSIAYVCSKRIPCAKNGNFKAFRETTGTTGIAMMWIVWNKKGFEHSQRIEFITYKGKIETYDYMLPDYKKK